MIKRLKLKYITLSMVSLFLLLIFVVFAMNMINYFITIKEIDQIVTLVAESWENVPDTDKMQAPPSTNRIPPHMSPETPHEARYFCVYLDNQNNIIRIDTTKVVTVDNDQATSYAKRVLDKKNKGFVDQFRFLKSQTEQGHKITFLDCGRKLDAMYAFCTISLIVSAFGYIIIFLVVVFLAGRIIEPVARSYKKQKTFITDAGHEIKTPLTIINANIDLIALEYGENEYLASIKQQAERLTELTNSLVYLAKMEEDEAEIQKIEFPLSDVVFESSNSFKASAQLHQKELELDIEPMLTIIGYASAIAQLTTILIDNAIKYSPQKSKVYISLKKQGKQIYFKVKNETLVEISRNECELIFERFYRLDASRNSSTGGHGVGLSIARAICEKHNAKISANTSGKKLTVEVIFQS